MTLEKLKVLIQAEIKPYQDAIKKVKEETRSATSDVIAQTSKIKSAFSGVAKFIAGLAIGRAIIGFGRSAIKMASDLQEVQNVVDTAFGSMSYKCEEFAKNAITQFGMSELSAKQTASTYMAMAKGIGMASDQASDMAIELAGLSGDVASFFNISQSEASTKLKSIFTGETETLKDLGVVMTQTNLKQYAMNQGISTNIEQMDQASLTMLRYKFVMDQLSLANGDFAKTSGSWANQVRILQEQWKQLLGIIGNGLVAVFTPVLRALNTMMSKIIQFAQTVSAVISAIFGNKSNDQKSAAAIMASDTDQATMAQDNLGNAVDATGKKAKKTAKEMRSIGGFDELNIIQPKNDTSDSGNSGAGGISASPIAGMDFGLDEEPDTSGVKKAVDKVMGYYNKFTGFLKKNKVIISSLLAGMFAGLGTFAIVKNLGSITAGISNAIGPLKTLFTSFQVFFAGISEGSGVMTSLSAVFGTVTASAMLIAVGVAAVTAAVVYLWQTSEQFRNIVIEAVNSIGSILLNFYESILQPLFAFLVDIFNTVIIPIATFLADVFVTAVDLLLSVVLSLWNNCLAPLVNFLVDVLAIALQGIIDVWTAWKPVIELIFTAIQWIWDTMLKPIVGWIKNTFIKTFEKWGDVIKTLMPEIEGIFQGLVTFLVGVFTLDVSKCMEGITQIFQSFDNFLSKVFSTDWTNSFGYFGNILNGFFATVSGIWESIKRIFSGIIDFVAGVFTGDWSRVWNGVVDIFGGIFDGIAVVCKAPINAVIGIINGAIDAINSISVDVPDWIPVVGGQHWGLDLGKLNYLAKGGIVTGPTLSVIGEAGKEAVMPLENNTGWISELASKIYAYGGTADSKHFDKMIDLLSTLIRIVDDKELKIGDRDIGEANSRYNNRKGFSLGTI